MEVQAASNELVLTLLQTLEDHGYTSSEVELVVEQILPVLVPAIVHLLKAVETSKEQSKDGEEVSPTIRPFDHLARFMLRRNPRHNKLTAEMIELQTFARKHTRK